MLVVKKSPSERKPVYHDAVLERHPISALQEGQILVKMGAVAFNRKDVRTLSIIILSRTGLHPCRSFGFVPGSIQVSRLEPRHLALMVQVRIERWSIQFLVEQRLFNVKAFQGRSLHLQIPMTPSCSGAYSSRPCEVGKAAPMRQNPGR